MFSDGPKLAPNDQDPPLAFNPVCQNCCAMSGRPYSKTVLHKALGQTSKRPTHWATCRASLDVIRVPRTVALATGVGIVTMSMAIAVTKQVTASRPDGPLS